MAEFIKISIKIGASCFADRISYFGEFQSYTDHNLETFAKKKLHKEILEFQKKPFCDKGLGSWILTFGKFDDYLKFLLYFSEDFYFPQLKIKFICLDSRPSRNFRFGENLEFCSIY